MAIDKLFSSFDKYGSLTLHERELLSARVLLKGIKRRQRILQQGDICRHYTFVVYGSLRKYRLDKKGVEHNLQFAGESEWITELNSFYSETVGAVYIEAMEPSVIYQIKKNDLMDLFDISPKIERNFRVIVEKKNMELENRILSTISTTAEERYLTFMHENPALTLKLPNKEIASFIGITPEFLSKVRKDIFRKC